MKTVLVKDLSYQYRPGGPRILEGIDFQLNRGEIVVVTGPSGCGKSTLCCCLSGTTRHNRNGIITGEILINGKNILEMSGSGLALEVGMVFQDPDTQLFSPTVEDEIAFAPENLCLPPEHIQERVDDVMDILGIASLRNANPSQLSGGEKHLVALAAVLALDPPVLIMDEVMSQLDANGKQKVAIALQKLRDAGKTIIAVEHNLENVAFADRVLILKDGKLVDRQGDGSLVRVETLTREPSPCPESICPPCQPFLEISQAAFYYPRKTCPAVTGINLSLDKKHITAITGPNGSGKTTLTKMMIGVLQASEGVIHLEGRPLSEYSLAQVGRRIGYVFQNPDLQLFCSTVAEEIAFGLVNHGCQPAAIEEKVDFYLDYFELAAYRNSWPMHLSQGEKQRLAIAAVLVNEPEFLILDEPTTGLDDYRKKLLEEYLYKAARLGTGMLIVSHDLSFVNRIAERVVVMEKGRIQSDSRQGGECDHDA
ncbi:MAG: energy-coupling factor transporter ATPase [Syntrophomonadaceae bacterium]|nr:energy-coupling factor transporter ATPase [Syntrophomonadaceae bacterium]